MTNPNSELEEGELMDQDPVLTTLEELLKVSTFKNSFAIIHFRIKPQHLIRKNNCMQILQIIFGLLIMIVN